MKDISENYIYNTRSNSSERYTDAGCFFSTSPFKQTSQGYAWAHNIFLVSFFRIPTLTPAIDLIYRFVSKCSEKDLKNMKKNELEENFWNENNNNNTINQSTLVVGIIDNLYPVVLVGEGDWIRDIDKKLSFGQEVIEATKTQRLDHKYESRFKLDIRGKKVYFVLPNFTANNIIEKIGNLHSGDKIFEIDIPFISDRKTKVRRFFKINVCLPNKETYVKHLKATVVKKTD
jgi:hypothetical protein